MNVYDGIHWNIYEILPYQRRFNFINGTRSLGKTYTTQMFLIDKWLTKKHEFVYIVRTQQEKTRSGFEQAFAKVMQNEFPNISYLAKGDILYKVEKDDTGGIISKEVMGYCLALSEAHKIKRRSFPNVKYLLFDEYMLEQSSSARYVNGWKEPDLLLSIYHTIDREEDRVICFILGNHVKFYNPYHMHPAFRIQEVCPGHIWTSKNVLYQNAMPSEALLEHKDGNDFLSMIDNTQYGSYAKDGKFLEDNYEFLATLTPSSRYIFTMVYNGIQFGIYCDYNIGIIFISDKPDPSCKFVYALTKEDHSENTLLTRGKTKSTHLSWLSQHFKLGNVRFTSMNVKARVQDGLNLIL